MKRCILACVLSLVAAASLAAYGPRAAEKADQVKRDAARLEQVKSVVLAPVLIQLRFDKDDRLPDPNRMAARAAVALRMQAMLEEQMAKGKYKLLPYEAASLAVKTMGWQPIDLFNTNVKGSWDSPCEKIQNNKKDEVLLLNTRGAMRETPDQMTQFRYKWHNLPETPVGLAAFKDMNFATPDASKIKTLGEKTGADAVLLMQVEDMETHEGAQLFGGFKSTRIHLHATLVATNDCAVIWQAHAMGMKSQRAGYFTGARAYSGEDRKAIESAAQAVELLLDDLFNGTGKPMTR